MGNDHEDTDADGKSLSILVPSPPGSGGIKFDQGTASNASYSTKTPQTTSPNTSESTDLDFIASSAAVKDLFALPYTPQDQPVSVAIYNLEGTLIFDRDPDVAGTSLQSKEKPSSLPNAEGASTNASSSTTQTSLEASHALVALSSHEKSEALTMVNSFLNSSHDGRVHPPSNEPKPSTAESSSLQDADQQPNNVLGLSLGVRQGYDYVSQHIPPTSEPREYIPWKWKGLNFMVGSDALVLRDQKTTDSASTTMALTLRVEDAKDMQALVEKHQREVESGSFKPEYELSALQQQGKPTYATMLLKSKSTAKQLTDGEMSQTSKTSVSSNEQSFAAPNLDQVQLQTCIVPARSVPLGGLLDSQRKVEGSALGLENASSMTDNEKATILSPVSTVLDAYLDNIIANVPQLALCLREKGFIQSVKLMETDKIPAAFLTSSTMDTAQPFSIVGDETEKVFSPQVMEMNASALLRFLKLNCTKDNSTYLLRREAGQSNIHLYDISSLSAMKQRKWIWWLAMISCRFAQRLKGISLQTEDSASRRVFRNRERGLLQNALELLEVLNDMDGDSHESLAAGVRESLADTFLRGEAEIDISLVSKDSPDTQETPKSPEPATSQSSSQQPYATISVDALNKAYDHLTRGITCLNPHFEENVKGIKDQRLRSGKRRGDGRCNVVSTINADGNSDDSSSDSDEPPTQNHLDTIATASQLFNLHEKIVNVSLRLAEIHLRNYYSSSAMQSLRSAARRISDLLHILSVLSTVDVQNRKRYGSDWLRRVQIQYVWLWEHCGHFARSFAGDSLWRDRGHASVDDILTVLQDSESAFTGNELLSTLPNEPKKGKALDLRIFMNPNPLTEKTFDSVNLHSLSGVVMIEHENQSQDALSQCRRILEKQKFLQREQRKAILAACLSYNRAIHAFESLEPVPSRGAPASSVETKDATFLGILYQRLGDACNEAGKILLSELRHQLSCRSSDFSDDAALAMLSSAEFWFEEGLRAFLNYKDCENQVLLRVNLCQCKKLRANALFGRSKTASHAEECLQEAANQLEAAHESLDERSVNPVLWDMVSAELAATFLVLGVRRRQSLVGSGNVPMILPALRLNPGQELSITDPIDRALAIYEASGNALQAAAAHYQLAQFYSKIWTCQRDEGKTREKLGAAFKHYGAAHAFFNDSVKGNELTLCLVCLDLSNLYSSVPGEEGNAKALFCCLDTIKALNLPGDTEASAIDRPDDLYEQINTVATSIEDRVFVLLRRLVKLFDDGLTKIPYKEVYRASLTAKMTTSKTDAVGRGAIVHHISSVRKILEATDKVLTNLGLK